MAESSSTSTLRRETRVLSLDDPPLMSSPSDPMNERLQCSICLDVFSDPVTTPCGHNFCKICLDTYWDNSQHCSCPNCKKKFKKRPELKINTTLRDLVDEHKKKTAEKPEVLCDICEEVKLKAVKSCLVCQSSYCETHLGRHLTVTGLQKHKLIDPVNNLLDYICLKHESPLELFCRDDQTPVCLICTVTDHKNHNTVTVKDEREKKKIELLKTQTDVQYMIQERIKKIQEIKDSAKLRRRDIEKEKAASVEIFTDLMQSIERCQSERMKMMEEKQKAAEKQDEDLIKDLEKDITELKRRNTELEKIINTEDHLDLIQIHSSMCRPLNINNLPEVAEYMKSLVIVEEMRRSLTRSLTQLQETLHEKLSQAGKCSAWETTTNLPSPSRDQGPWSSTQFLPEFTWMQKYAVDVTLDPDTANPYLILSDDNKQVRTGDIRCNLPYYPKRFDNYLIVLGKQGFSSGRFYYEVHVKGKTAWNLGVVRESVNRKGEATLTTMDGFWTVSLRNGNQYSGNGHYSVSLSLSVNPQKVGVFVDYEEGLVSFHDVDSRSHIYSFTDQSFNEKLYPYFNPHLNNCGINSKPLIITPVNNNK